MSRNLHSERRTAAVASFRRKKEKEPVVTEVTELDLRSAVSEMIEEISSTIAAMGQNIAALEQQIAELIAQVNLVDQSVADGLIVRIYRTENADGDVEYTVKTTPKKPMGF